jgi:hypothetical protein
MVETLKVLLSKAAFSFSFIGGILFTALFTATWLWPDWIELVVGADPDGGSGETEWLLLFAFGFAALAAWALVRWEWRASRATIQAR